MSGPTIQELRKFKHAKGDPRNYWFDGLSTYVVKWLFSTTITPLQVNLSVTLVGVCIGFFFMTGTLWGRIVGVSLFFLHIILDAVDGQLARARDDCTLKGEYLDKIGHYIAHPFIAMAIGYGNYLLTSNTLVVWAGFAMGLATTLSSASGDCFKMIYKDAASRTRRIDMNATESAKNTILKILRFETMLYLVLFSSLMDSLWKGSTEMWGFQFSIESYVIILYSGCLLASSVIKIYTVLSREQLVSR